MTECHSLSISRDPFHLLSVQDPVVYCTAGDFDDLIKAKWKPRDSVHFFMTQGLDKIENVTCSRSNSKRFPNTLMCICKDSDFCALRQCSLTTAAVIE